MEDLKMTARYILVLLPPTVKTGFNVRLGIQTNIDEVRSTGDIAITKCETIAKGVAHALNVIDNLGLKFAEDFTLVYPMFHPATEEEEVTIINTAWEIKAIADEHQWLFARTIPIYNY